MLSGEHLKAQEAYEANSGNSYGVQNSYTYENDNQTLESPYTYDNVEQTAYSDAEQPQAPSYAYDDNAEQQQAPSYAYDNAEQLLENPYENAEQTAYNDADQPQAAYPYNAANHMQAPPVYGNAGNDVNQPEGRFVYADADPACCRPCVCKGLCSGLQLYAELLYWKVVQDQIPYAAVIPGGVQQVINGLPGLNSSMGDVTAFLRDIDRALAQDAVLVQISEEFRIVDPCFKYKPGFRIGLGYELPCCNWNLHLAWTRLHEKRCSRVADDAQGIFPLTVPVSTIFGFIGMDVSEFGFASRAASRWDFEFDTLDIDIGSHCACACLNVRPFVGVKLANIKQNQRIAYFGFAIDPETIINVRNYKKNHFEAAGLSIGVDSSWTFWERLSLTSGIGAALMCGKINACTTPRVSQDENFITVRTKSSKKCRVRPTVNANIGLSWEPCVCDCFQLQLGVAYEVQYWWNQWQAVSSFESSFLTGGICPQGDLMMQGLTARIGIAF